MGFFYRLAVDSKTKYILTMSRTIYLFVTLLLFSVGQSWAKYELTPSSKEHFDRGYELFDAGSYRAANIEFQKARELASELDIDELARIDYYLVTCASKTGEFNAMALLDDFLESYPTSIYTNSVRFGKANLLYQEGDYQDAVRDYVTIDKRDLTSDEQDEYNFKLGHSFFVIDDITNARSSLSLVAPNGPYGVHATYYTAYIDYVSENYGSAKQRFLTIEHNPLYADVIPFYILQIEFLEGNYDYVLRHGDELLVRAKGEREAEIARIMGEAWFHNSDYAKTLDYMARYQNAGGEMGRGENYLVGYSNYIRNDIADAIDALTKVVGPDDQLTQNAAYHLGGCYIRANDKYRAMQSFSMASTADYDPVIKEDALFNYGKLQYELDSGVFNEAINILNKYIREYPNSSRINEAREYLIAAYYNSKNYNAAYEAIKQIPNPDNNLRTAYQKIAYFRGLEYFNEGDYDLAMRFLDESLQNRFNPKYTALTQFWRGEVFYKRGEYTQAIPLYRDYVRLSPETEQEHIMALYNLGYSYFNEKRWNDANGWFTRFLSTYRANDRYRADALNRRGDANFTMRQFGQATNDYNAALQIGGDERYHAEYQKAMIEGLTGKRAQKVNSLQSIITAGRGDYVGDAMYEQGRTYMLMERFNDAANVLKRFTEQHPTSDKYLAALSELGLAYQNLNNNNTALRYYKEIAEKAPSSSEARDALAAAKSIYVDMNDVDGYFRFAQSVGVETDTGVVARDSLTYAAAERVYMTSSNRGNIISSFRDYLDKFPRGSYRANALYYIAEHYIGDKQYGKGIDALEELSQMHYNNFSVRGLEKLAPLCYDQREYDKAAVAYKKLAETSVNPETKGGAYEGYLNSVKAEGDDAKMMAAANEVLAAKSVPEATVRSAKFIKAQQLSKHGNDGEALQLYRELATESKTLAGAESTYHVIEALYNEGDYNAAENRILDFSAENTPHAYWLGRAFLRLGDIYSDRGDTFQARATLQSIVDGYSPADDGIVEAAKERISELGN